MLETAQFTIYRFHHIFYALPLFIAIREAYLGIPLFEVWCQKSSYVRTSENLYLLDITSLPVSSSISITFM